MTRRAALRRFGRSRAGNAAVEFVFILPVMLSIMGGMVEFGRAFQVYGAVNRLATRYAIAWADCSDNPSGTCNTELSLYTPTAAMQNVAPQLTSAIALRMMEVTMSGSTASVIYAFPAGATPTAAEITVAQSAIPSGQTGIIVTVAYTHTLMFFQQLMTPFLGASRNVTSTVAQLKS